jgi:hypothetical protein
MKTIEEIKTEILALNPSKIYIFNGEEFEQTDNEFNEAIQKKAEMTLEQETFLLKKETEKQIKISAYQKLGLTQEEINALMPPEPEPEPLIGSN